jgi:hypothetical protein
MRLYARQHPEEAARIEEEINKLIAMANDDDPNDKEDKRT